MQGKTQGWLLIFSFAYGQVSSLFRPQSLTPYDHEALLISMPAKTGAHTSVL